MTEEEREVEQYRISRDGADVGELACYVDTCNDEVQALTGAGFTVDQIGAESVAAEAVAVDETPAQEETLHALDAECSDDDHQACDIAVAVAYLRDTAAEAGIDAPELHEMMEHGYRDQAQVVEVMETVAARLPDGQALVEAQGAIALARGEIDIDAEAEDAATAAPTE